MIENSDTRNLILFTQVMPFIENNSKDIIIPARGAPRRTQWDATFTLSYFSICYQDRVDDSIHKCAMDETNDSIKGT